MRARILAALIETSRRADASTRLLSGPSLADEVERNIRILELPVRPVLDVYTGVVHEGLDVATLSPAAAARAAAGEVVIASALWGLLRPADEIPPYRLNICSRLVGMDRLEPAWRTVLPEVLAAAAGLRGVVFDTRAASYQALGLPAGLGDRTVILRVNQAAADGRRIGTVFAKRLRGQAARHLLESGADPGDPLGLGEVLAERWPMQLDPPARPGRPWTVTLSLPA
jgi:cytoplasmic iron level regulating protein YaaA (DUF328/UPF0246 family)